MHVYVDRTDFVPSCTVVMSRVSVRVKQLHALRSRMSTCLFYRALKPLFLLSTMFNFSFFLLIFGVNSFLLNVF